MFVNYKWSLQVGGTFIWLFFRHFNPLVCWLYIEVLFDIMFVVYCFCFLLPEFSESLHAIMEKAEEKSSNMKGIRREKSQARFLSSLPEQEIYCL